MYLFFSSNSRAGDEEDFEDGDEAGLDFLIQRNLAGGHDSPDDMSMGMASGHGGGAGGDFSLHSMGAAMGISMGIGGSPGNTLREEISSINRANGILGLHSNNKGSKSDGAAAGAQYGRILESIQMLEKSKHYGIWNTDTSYTSIIIGLFNNREKHIFDKQDVLGQISDLDPQDMIPIISSCQFALCV